MRKLVVVLFAAITLTVGAAACASNSDHSSLSSSDIDKPDSSEPFNVADVSFAQDMIPHHAQAIEMAEFASSRATSPEVKDLAARIEAAQQPEIDQMNGWLEDWDQDVPSTSSMDMDSQMGMMSAADMKDLRGASGNGFDSMFLEMMIRHHEGAVAMAETELDDGKYPPAKALALKIVDAQEAEITEMQALLDTGA